MPKILLKERSSNGPKSGILLDVSQRSSLIFRRGFREKSHYALLIAL
jgi:hypothetical protein